MKSKRTQRGALDTEADFGEAQEAEAKDGSGISLGLEARVGAELVGGIPKALFQNAIGGVFFGWGNPVHEAHREIISIGLTGKPNYAEWQSRLAVLR